MFEEGKLVIKDIGEKSILDKSKLSLLYLYLFQVFEKWIPLHVDLCENM